MRRFARMPRRPDANAAGVRLPALRATRPVFVCPACGKVHPGGFFRLLWLVALVLPAWWLVPRPALSTAVSDGIPRRSAGLKPGAMLPGAGNVRQTRRSEQTPGPSSVSGALAVPTTAVVWNRSGAGTYLWAEPGGRITGFLHNGLWVALLESWQGAGGVPFGAVRAGEVSGWADMRAVHRLPRPAEPVLLVRPDAGASLLDAPGGTLLRWLPPGTPLLLSGPETEGWAGVALLVGGQAGWLLAAALFDLPER